MIEWVTVEDAIHDWIETATGISGADVFQAGDGGHRPSGRFVEYELEVERVGRDWLDHEDADTPEAGAELDFKARGIRRMNVRLRCFGGTASGAGSARASLEKVVAKFPLPTYRAIVANAGIGVASFSRVQNISGVLNSSIIEPRAMLDITCYLASEVSEPGTYIENVSIDACIEGQPDDTWIVEGGLAYKLATPIQGTPGFAIQPHPVGMAIA